MSVRAFDCVWFGDASYPLSEDVFQALLDSPQRVVVMPTTNRRAQVAPWHVHAHYSPELSRAQQDGKWMTTDPVALARQVVEFHEQQGFYAPWVFCNEISYKTWRQTVNEPYREWVNTFAEALADGGLWPVVYSPIEDPRSEADNWSRLARAGYVGIEGYLDPVKVDSVEYCADAYAEMRDAYVRLGVPQERQVLVEIFAQTVAGATYGRGGLPLVDWLNVVRCRVAGAKAAGFGMIGSFEWGYNAMGVSGAELRAGVRAYTDAVAL